MSALDLSTGSRGSGLLGRLSQVGRKLSWGVADQGVSSLSNFAVNIYIARLLGAEQYGTFAVVFVTYAFALNASRGLVSDPLMIRFSHVEHATWRRVTADSSGAAVAIGLALGAGLLVAAGLLRGTLGLGLLALALTLPGLLLQDSWRFAFFSAGRGFQAFLNDAIWLVVLLVAMAALRWAHVANVFWAVLAWGGAATVAGLIGPLQAKVMPRLGRTRDWLTRQRDLGLRYMAEGMTNSLSNQLRTYGVGLVLGLAAVGYVNAANTLMAAFVVLVSGSALILLPQATRLWRDNPQGLVRFCATICVAEAAGAAVWGAILLVSLPLGLGHWLLGGIWRPSYSLVLPTLLVTMGFCVTVGPGIGLKGMGASRQSLRSAVLTAPLYVGFSLIGAGLDGAYGAVMGTAVAMWISAAIYWWQLRVAVAASSAHDGRVPSAAMSDPSASGRRPRLVVGLPTYNGERFLAPMLDSILAQTFTDFELIISDNASTDGTEAIARSYAARDPRIRYIRHPKNMGSAYNHTFALRQADGELFKWASDDDLYEPDLFERCIAALDARPDVVLAHCRTSTIDADGHLVDEPGYRLGTDDPDPAKRLDAMLYTIGGDDIYGILRMNVMRRMPDFGTFLHPDRAFVTELALQGPFHNVPAALYHRRHHPGQGGNRALDIRRLSVIQDPTRANRLRHPKVRLVTEYLLSFPRAIHRAPLSRRQKARCYWTYLGWVAAHATPARYRARQQGTAIRA